MKTKHIFIKARWDPLLWSLPPLPVVANTAMQWWGSAVKSASGILTTDGFSDLFAAKLSLCSFKVKPVHVEKQEEQESKHVSLKVCYVN